MHLSNKIKSTMHRINPLGMRVLVQLIKDEDMTDSGLYLPEGSKETMTESVLGKVISVATAVDEITYEDENISGIPMDACVLIQKDIGTRVPWDDQLRIVDTHDVLAIVDKIDLS